MNPTDRRWRRPPWTLLALAGLLGLATVLRFTALGAESLWLDEGTSVYYSQLDVASILRNAPVDNHPPTYYLLLKAWTAAFGLSEAAVRALSALAGIAAVCAVYCLGRDLDKPRVGVFAAALVTVSWAAVWYSQEARSYSLLLLSTTLAAHAYVRHFILQVPGSRLRFWATSLLALYLHVAAVFVLAGLALHRLMDVLTVRGPGAWRRSFAGFLPIGLAYVPWLLAVVWQTLRFTSAPERFAPPTLALLQQVVSRLLGLPREGILAVAAFLGICLGTLVQRSIAKDRSAREWSWRSLPWILVGASFVLPVVLSAVGTSFFHIRVLLPSLAPFAVLVGQGLDRLPSRPVKAVAVVFLLAINLPPLHTSFERIEKEDWRGAVAIIKADAGPDDVVFAYRGFVFRPMWYYDPDPTYTLIPVVDDLTPMSEVQAHAQAADGAWLVVSHARTQPEELFRILRGEFPHETQMDRGNIDLHRFARSPTSG